MASWGFGSLWGGNAAKKKDSTKNAILGLRSTLEMLSKREKHLQNQMDEQDAIARKNVSTNKGGEYLRETGSLGQTCTPASVALQPQAAEDKYGEF